MTSLRPLGNRIVVEAKAHEEMTRSGIYLPDTSREKPQEGTVVAVGPGRRLDNGKLAPVEVEVGQRVLYAKWAGTEVKIDDKEVLIFNDTDVLAVITDNNK
ncbi:MAG: co-chaperone GroES [Chloroflexi bacterium]|nr:co-chaperone GroES [Chloroflexota bacterium]